MIAQGEANPKYAFWAGVYLSTISLVLIGFLVFLDLQENIQVVISALILVTLIPSLSFFSRCIDFVQLPEQIYTFKTTNNDTEINLQGQVSSSQDLTRRAQAQKTLVNQKLTDLLPPIDVTFLEVDQTEVEHHISSEDKAQVDQLLGQLQALSELVPFAIDEYLNQGNALLWETQFEEAIVIYNKVLKLNPDASEAWYQKGNALLSLKQFDKAIGSYDKALEINPQKPVFWNNRGSALNRLGRFDEAVKSFDKALSLDPDFDVAWNNRGFALIGLKQFDDAIASLDKIQETDSDYDIFQHNRGVALIGLKKFEEAISNFNRVIELKPDISHSYYHKARALALLGYIKEAIDTLSKAIELDSEYREKAKTNTAFDNIQDNEKFQMLLSEN